MNLQPLQGDPTTLETWGGAWIGIVIPGVVLVLSIVLSIWLYRHFAQHGKT